MRNKINIGDAVNIAHNRLGKCLSKSYKNAHTKLLWECKLGHRWYASYNNVKRGTWCNICSTKRAANKLKLQLNDAIALAKKFDGNCLSKEYLNSKSKMAWKCKNNHVWYAKLDNVRSGKWCPLCRAKTQEKLFNICKAIFKDHTVINNFRGANFLINDETGRKQEIDIWIPKFKIAIEYDGEQHFKPVKFGGISDEKATRNFEYIKKMDRLKTSKIINEGIIFIRFKYTDNITLESVAKYLFNLEII